MIIVLTSDEFRRLSQGAQAEILEATDSADILQLLSRLPQRVEAPKPPRDMRAMAVYTEDVCRMALMNLSRETILKISSVIAAGESATRATMAALHEETFPEDSKIDWRGLGTALTRRLRIATGIENLKPLEWERAKDKDDDRLRMSAFLRRSLAVAIFTEYGVDVRSSIPTPKDYAAAPEADMESRKAYDEAYRTAHEAPKEELVQVVIEKEDASEVSHSETPDMRDLRPGTMYHQYSGEDDS